MSTWKQSRALTAKCRDLVKSRKDLLAWPVRAVVFGGIVGLVTVLPGAIILAVSDSTPVMVAGGVLVVVGLVAAATAANLQLASLVVSADEALHGRHLDKTEARDRAGGHLGDLLGWSVVSVVVGLIVGAIRGNGDSGIATTILRGLLSGLIAAAWSFITFFVLPVMILEKVGTVTAIKRSASIVRQKYGMTIVGSVRIGARFALMYILPGVLILAAGVAGGIVLGGATGIAIGAIGVIVGGALIVIGGVWTSTCKNVFGVALYRWASDGEVLGPFNDDELAAAAKSRA